MNLIIRRLNFLVPTIKAFIDLKYFVLRMELATCSRTIEQELLQNEKIANGNELFNDMGALKNLFSKIQETEEYVHIHGVKRFLFREPSVHKDIENKIDNILSYLNSLIKDTQNSNFVGPNSSTTDEGVLKRIDLFISFFLSLSNLDNKDPAITTILVHLTNNLLNFFRPLQFSSPLLNTLKYNLIADIEDNSKFCNSHDLLLVFLRTKRGTFIELMRHINSLCSDLKGTFVLFDIYDKDPISISDVNLITIPIPISIFF